MITLLKSQIKTEILILTVLYNDEAVVKNQEVIKETEAEADIKQANVETEADIIQANIETEADIIQANIEAAQNIK